VPRGAIYGPEHTPEQFGPWRYRAKGPVDGLYLCGSSVMGAGIGTCVASGMMAARMALAEEKRSPRFALGQKKKLRAVQPAAS
jgi:phytoene dehydrogenase-like protein